MKTGWFNVTSELEFEFEEHIYQSYREYYLGNPCTTTNFSGKKLFLRGSRYTSRDIPDWILNFVKTKEYTVSQKISKDDKTINFLEVTNN